MIKGTDKDNKNKADQKKEEQLAENCKDDNQREGEEKKTSGEDGGFDDFVQTMESRRRSAKSLNCEEKIQEECKEFLKHYTYSRFFEEISDMVVGQEEGLNLLLTAVYSYIEGIAVGKTVKINAIITAQSGCGKTQTYRALKKVFGRTGEGVDCGIPSLVISFTDLARLTPEGFKGKDPSSIISEFKEKGCSWGLLFMDEIDKRIIPSMTSGGQNVSSEVLGQLLALIEGSQESSSKSRTGYIDTGKIMFVGMGSFQHARDRKKSERQEKSKQIGFVRNFEEDTGEDNEITREDMLQMDCSPEFLGRFSLIINYHTLTEESLKKIIYSNVREISNMLNLNFWLGEDFSDYLLQLCGSKYGARIVHAEILRRALEAKAECLRNGLYEDGNYPVALIDLESNEVMQGMDHQKKTCETSAE